ncbi:MAG: hypothetical protein ABS96_29265 [Lysobacteraceae bacterium SCN 69-123]|nr:MAG: hypothetical protein ABS96_29265 [Xanthomonadaceae bacterium SCN 69-123]
MMAAQATLVEAQAQLDAFTHWLGAERLEAAQAPLRGADLGPLRYTRQLQRQWVTRDVLKYLEARTRGAVNEALVLQHLMPLCRLASAVLRFERVGATPVPGRYRDLLLGEACADYAHELLTAAHHDWCGYQVRWLQEGVPGGEFALRVAGDPDEVFVECKRLAADLVEVLKTDEVVALAETLERELQARGWCGTVRLDLGPRHLGRPSLIAAVEHLATTFKAERGEAQSGDITAHFDLRPVETVLPYQELLALAASRDPVHRVITGRRQGAQVARPRVFEFSGPKRDGAWFARKIESVVIEEAADRQLSSMAPGVVCLELPMFRDVDPVETLEIVSPVIDMLFAREHVIGFFGVLDLTTTMHGDFARANAPGRVIWNEGSRFQAAQARWRQLMDAQG